MEQPTQPQSITRVPDSTQASATYALGVSANSYPWGFVLDFLTHDLTGEAMFMSADRVYLEPSAMQDVINGLTKTLAEYVEAYGDPDR